MNTQAPGGALQQACIRHRMVQLYGTVWKVYIVVLELLSWMILGGLFASSVYL
jgi:hypothetical protein